MRDLDKFQDELNVRESILNARQWYIDRLVMETERNFEASVKQRCLFDRLQKLVVSV